jgi:LPS export ABC transporter protein LptC/lipopolysaccharide transport protein LptA
MQLRAVKIMRRSLIGLVIAVILLVAFNYLQVWYRRARLVQKATQILSPEMLRSFEGFEYSSTPNGILRFRLKAKRLVETRQGKSYIEGIEAYDFNPDGSIRNSIRSANGIFDSEHNNAEFSGDVRVFLSDEFELRTNSLRYDLSAKKGETQGRLQFISKIASGTAKGVVFDQGLKTLEFKSDVEFVLNAKETTVGGATVSGQFHVAANRAFCTEDAHRVIFQGPARIYSEEETLSGDRIEAILSPDRKRLVSLISAGNAAYRSEKAGETQLMQGDQIVFGIGHSQTLEKISVAGQATFSSGALSEAQTLSGREIDLFFDPATANPLSIEGRGSVSFHRKDGKAQILVSGNTFVAAFSQGSKSLQSVIVRGQAAMSMEDAESGTHNELKSDEIRLSFQDVDGRTVFQTLRAEGAARWVSGSSLPKTAVRPEPARTLETSLLEMVFSREGDSFESGSASGNVVISENRSETGDGAQLSRLRADYAQFYFFPGNKLRNMTASGHVRASYEKRESLKKQPTPASFSASSDNMAAIFALRDGESAVESAAQWGNFVYKDASMTATAGRCEYDAHKGILVLKESPRISDELSSTSGERMEYELRQKAVAVYGRVRSRLNAKNGAGSFMASSSPSSPAIVTADEMRYWTEERRARYAGKVQVLSENGQLQAGRLDVIEGGDRVEAQESIRHYIPQRVASKTGEQADKVKEKRDVPGSEMTIQSASLKYERQKNMITYGGHVTARSGELNLSSDTLEAMLADSGGGIEHAIARGQVRIRQDRKEGKADVADYFLNPHKFVLTGNPAEINEPGKVHSSAPQLTYFIADDRILFGNKQE